MMKIIKLLGVGLLLGGFFLWGAGPVNRIIGWDTNQSNYLEIIWNENDTGNRVFNLLVAGANRSLTINEDLVIGDGSAGTITFSAGSKTLTIAESATINANIAT